MFDPFDLNDRPPTSDVIPRVWFDQCLTDMVTWLCAEYPSEGCGLVVLEQNTARFISATNLVSSERASTAYELSPLCFIDAEKEGGQVVAIVHSHVDLGDHFSSADVVGATMASDSDGVLPTYPGVDHVVFSIYSGRAERASVYRFSDIERGFVRVYRWTART